MNFKILLVVFVVIEKVHVSNVKNFVEIKISYANENFEKPNLKVIRFNASNVCHDAAKWAKDRKGKPWIQCEVRMKFTRCFCDLEAGNCWDFEDVLEAIYILQRDPAISSIPKDSFSHAGNEKAALEKIITILNTLHKNAPKLSDKLQKEAGTMLSMDEGFDKDQCKNVSVFPHKKEKEALKNRKEVGLLVKRVQGLKVYTVKNDYCFHFFSRLSQNLYVPHSTRILMMREKLLDQINSNQKLYLCESMSKSCDLDRVKRKLLSEKLNLFLDYTSLKTKALYGQDFDMSEAKDYFDWKPTREHGNSKVQGIIVVWVHAAVFLVLIVIIIRSVCQYEPKEQRTPLDPTTFKLKDIEKELKKAMLGKTPEKSVMTLEATRDLEKAKQLDKKRQKKPKAAIFRSVYLKTPKEASDLESVKRKPDSKALNLQKTQNDVTEFIGTAIENKLPAVPIQTRPPAPEKSRSVQSRTDQGTFVNKEKSDEHVGMKSIQKTQSLTSDEVIEMAPLLPPPPPPPNPSPHQPPPPPPQIHIPTVNSSPRLTTPLHNMRESKKLRRKKPKSKSSANTPGKLKKKKSKADQSHKEKKKFLSFWS